MLIPRKILSLTSLVLSVNLLLGSEPALSDEQFQMLSLRLSEENGFFPTDNLVSNETSYLHNLPLIRKFVKPGNAYIGVGPEQNFSYIIHSRPAIAFIIDIRRDNLLLHLWLKEIFISSTNRWDYMSNLFGRPLPPGFEPDRRADVRQLIEFFEKTPPDSAFSSRRIGELWQSIHTRFPKLAGERDRSTVARIARAFHLKGLKLAYEIPGRSELSFFPSWGSLAVATDRDGNLGHYLNSAEGFDFLKSLHVRNRLIPVVGNFAGSKALRGIGRELSERGYEVGIFYLSNVEFYLFRNATLQHFVRNVKGLPIGKGSLMVRSYFNQLTGYNDSHPAAVPGFLSVTLTQSVGSFLTNHVQESYRDYWDLVTREYMSLEELVPVEQ